MDKIYIRDILVRCIIGVHDRERTDKQDVIINITLTTDLRKPGQTDDVSDTIDYSAIKKRVVEAVEGSRYMLLEALAQRVADVCLDHDAVERVQVTVDKPGALRFARSVAVEINRSRQ